MIFELAGSLGVDPSPFTLRELFWMHEGADRSRWDHTALLAAILVNANRDPKRSKAVTVADFHPYEEKTKGTPLTPQTIDSLKVFLR